MNILWNFSELSTLIENKWNISQYSFNCLYTTYAQKQYIVNKNDLASRSISISLSCIKFVLQLDISIENKIDGIVWEKSEDTRAVVISWRKAILYWHC